MIANELYKIEEHKIDNPLITDLDSMLDNFFKDCHINFFHKPKYKCIYIF